MVYNNPAYSLTIKLQVYQAMGFCKDKECFCYKNSNFCETKHFFTVYGCGCN